MMLGAGTIYWLTTISWLTTIWYLSTPRRYFYVSVKPGSCQI